MLVIKDQKTKYVFCHVVDKKRGYAWVVRRINEDIDSLGYQQVIIRTDGENAIKDLRAQVSRQRAQGAMWQTTTKGDSKTGGMIGRGVQSVEGQIRAIKLGLEKRLGCRLEQNWVIIHWIVELAGMHISRYQRGHDGMTPYRRLTGNDWKQHIVEMGEVVEYKPLKAKTEPRDRMSN